MDPIKSQELEVVKRLQAHRTSMIQTRSTITGGELFHRKTSHTKQRMRRKTASNCLNFWATNNLGSGSSLHTRT